MLKMNHLFGLASLCGGFAVLRSERLPHSGACTSALIPRPDRPVTRFFCAPVTAPAAPESEQWSYRFATVNGQTPVSDAECAHAADPNAPFDQVSFNLLRRPSNYRPAEGGGVSPVAGWYAAVEHGGAASVDRARRIPIRRADAFVAAGRP